MPDLGRHETEWAVESAWFWVCRYYTYAGGSVTFYLGELSRSVETPDWYCQIVCTMIEPASTEVGDKIEICTVDIDYRISKQSTNAVMVRNRLIADFRRTIQESSLASWLELGMQYRGGITTTTNEPLKVYHALYQPENILYFDNSDRDYHSRKVTVQTVVGA